MTQHSGRAGLVLGHEGVGDALHAVHGADEGDRGAPADHQAEMSGVLGQLVGVVRVTEVLDGVVQHDVQQRIKPLQSPTGLTAPGKLDSDLLVNKPEEEGEIKSLYYDESDFLHKNICQSIQSRTPPTYLLRSRMDSFFFLSPPSPDLLGADMIFLDLLSEIIALI